MSKSTDTDCLHEIRTTGDALKANYNPPYVIKTDEPIPDCDDCIHAFVCVDSMHKAVFGNCIEYEERRKIGVWEIHKAPKTKICQMVCPFCKMTYVDEYNGSYAFRFKFCPNCGARLG